MGDAAGAWRERLRALEAAISRGGFLAFIAAVPAGSTFTRWSNGNDAGVTEFIAESGTEDHLLVVALRPWDVTYNLGRRTGIDAVIPAGDVVFRGPNTARSH